MSVLFSLPVLIALLGAEPDAAVLREYAQQCEEDRVKRIEGTKEAIKKAKIRFNKSRRGTYSSKQAKKNDMKRQKDKLADMKVELKKLESGNLPYYSKIPGRPPKVGDMGRLRYERVNVVQVVDQKNMLVRMIWYSAPGGGGGSTGAMRAGSRAAYSAIVRASQPTPRYYTLWVYGVPTGDAVDGSGVTLNQVFVISRTKQYETLLGMQTVFVLEPVDTTLLEPYRKPDKAKTTKP